MVRKISINSLPIEGFQNHHLEEILTINTPNLHFLGETSVLPMAGSTGEIHGVDTVLTEIPGGNQITVRKCNHFQ